MAKLSLSVNGNKDDQENEMKPVSLSLTKKVTQPTEDNNNEITSTGLSQHVQSSNTSGNASLEADDIAKWLVNNIGNDVFDELKQNPNLQLPYTDKNINAVDWMGKIIKTYFSQDSINKINSAINNLSGNNNVDNNAVEVAVKQKLEKYNAKFQELKEQMENLEGEKAQIASELNTAIPLSKFVSEIFRDPGNETEPQKEIIRTLNETFETSKEQTLSKFVVRFAKGWIYLKTKTDLLGDDEKQNLESVYQALTKLLEYVSECYISERRILLDLIAKHCSTFFSQYDFISPEQTLNADPDIHNAGGLGNARIKEGVSFCVVRRDTKKTVKYADIVVSS
ncbi:MAG: hypothetical protein MJ211_13405 [Bacteroidales bacterium]|nr:hypothetical protein [Bacteroidales bacterium]